AMEGLGPAFIDPSLAYLDRHGASVRFHHQLRHIEFIDHRVSALDFGEDGAALAPGDAVILAVPAAVASMLVPGLSAPTAFRAIVNAHFKLAAPKSLPRLLGVVNGSAEWLFAF